MSESSEETSFIVTFDTQGMEIMKKTCATCHIDSIEQFITNQLYYYRPRVEKVDQEINQDDKD